MWVLLRATPCLRLSAAGPVALVEPENRFKRESSSHIHHLGTETPKVGSSGKAGGIPGLRVHQKKHSLKIPCHVSCALREEISYV